MTRRSTTLLLFAILGTTAPLAHAASPKPSWQAPLVGGATGSSLPNFTLATRTNRRVSLQSLNDHPLLVAVIPDTCTTTCLEAAALLATINRTHNKNVLRVVIASTPRAAQLARIARRSLILVSSRPRLRLLQRLYGLRQNPAYGLVIGVDRKTRWRFAYKTNDLDPAKLANDTNTLSRVG